MIRIYSDPDAAKYVWGMGWHWCLGLEGCCRGVFIVFAVVLHLFKHRYYMILLFFLFFCIVLHNFDGSMNGVTTAQNKPAAIHAKLQFLDTGMVMRDMSGGRMVVVNPVSTMCERLTSCGPSRSATILVMNGPLCFTVFHCFLC